MENIKIKNLGDSNYQITNTLTKKSVTCYKQFMGVTSKCRSKHISVFCGWSSDGFNSFCTRKELISVLLK